jgi:hypothetical protein
VTSRTIAVAQLVVAVAALVGSVLSWLASTTVEAVPPILDGEPVMSSTVYDPSWVLVALLLGAVAGVAAVAGIVRLRRS